MKIASVRDVKARLSAYIDEAQASRVIVTNHGRPVALVVGIEGLDLESAVRASDPEFWKMIETRRKSTPAGKGIPAAEVRRRLTPRRKRRA
jgi:prevent-host-death family protein